MSQVIPQIGHWYQDSRSGAVFEIVALDVEESTVQVQYIDGEIADLDTESWGELILGPAAAPEDWRSACELDDGLDSDSDDAMHPTAWASPLASVEPDAMVGVEDL
jgi:hypothetical protein